MRRKRLWVFKSPSTASRSPSPQVGRRRPQTFSLILIAARHPALITPLSSR
jgi:hypothetical protein